MIKVSVIVPVFNAALFIEQCLSSLLNQTMRDIEVIAVNDGSTDDSKTILDRIAATDCRLKIFHSRNRGVSASRNLGLHHARGEYIAFTDADDWANPTMVEDLYNALRTNGCEWAICNVHLVQPENIFKSRLQLIDKVIKVYGDRPAFISNLMRFKYDYANWNKLYSATIIRNQNLRFAEDMCIWEDLLFNLQYLQFVGQVTIISTPLYNYRILPTALFSGKSKDLLPQFNFLYKHYLQFAATFATNDEEKAFRGEMARIAYYQLLPEAAIKVKDQQISFSKGLHAYEKEIASFDPGIFYYPKPERKGIQGLKKRLLQQGNFGWYAFITFSKSWLQSKYRSLRGIVNGKAPSANGNN